MAWVSDLEPDCDGWDNMKIQKKRFLSLAPLLFDNHGKKGRLRGRILAPKVTWTIGIESPMMPRFAPARACGGRSLA
jgi:hypothetical protein